MSHSKLAGILQDALDNAITELLEPTGLSLHDGAEDQEAPHVCAVLGFTGPKVRGTLLLAASQRALASLPHEGLPKEWLAELSNQLLGRVKIHLLPWDLEIYLATPAVIAGERLRPLVGPVGPELASARTGGLWVWVECETIAPLELPEGPSNPSTLDLDDGLFF
jgi:hypothetical protein